jgi:hypothetical protein
MGFGLQSIGVAATSSAAATTTVVVVIVTSAAATTTNNTTTAIVFVVVGVTSAAAAVVGKALLDYFCKYFEYNTRFHTVAMFVSVDLSTIFHTQSVITSTCPDSVVHHLPLPNR